MLPFIFGGSFGIMFFFPLLKSQERVFIIRYMALHYVKNKELYLEIIKSKDSSCATAELMGMFFKMSNGLANKFNFSQQDREDCIMGGVEDAWKYFWNFDASISTNAFAYITQIIKNGQFKTHRDIYKSYFKDIGYKQVSINNIYNL